MSLEQEFKQQNSDILSKIQITKNNRVISLLTLENLPADDSFCPMQAISYPPPELPVDLEGHPHWWFRPRQGQRSVAFSVHNVDVSTSGEEQPEKRTIVSSQRDDDSINHSNHQRSEFWCIRLSLFHLKNPLALLIIYFPHFCECKNFVLCVWRLKKHQLGIQLQTRLLTSHIPSSPPWRQCAAVCLREC